MMRLRTVTSRSLMGSNSVVMIVAELLAQNANHPRELDAASEGPAGGAFAEGCALRDGVLDAVELLRRQLDIDRGDVLLDVGDAFRARNRNDVLPAREHPRNGELRGR